MKIIRNGLLSLCGAVMLLSSTPTIARTFPCYGLFCPSLRCYYRLDPASTTNVQVGVTWARKLNSSTTYRVPGHWWSQSFSLANMFYTNVPNEQLVEECQATLKRENKGPFVMYAIADYDHSYNYMAWNVDTEDTKNEPEKINRIVAFGDSLSDTNNFLNGMGYLDKEAGKSYYAGRFTNGPNWLDILSGYLKLAVYNWAIAGAGTEDYYFSPGVKLINGIVSQVNSWVEYMDTSFMYSNNVNSNKFYNPKNTLFTVLIGGNDVLTHGTKVDRMISQEKQALTTLINYGAKNILLFTLPDLSRTPLFSPNNLIRKPNPNDPKTDPQFIKEQVLEYNDGVEKLAAGLKAEYGNRINIHVFDAYSLVNEVLKNPDEYGFTNSTDSCLEVTEETTDTYKNKATMRKICHDANNKPIPESFIYFDLLHPTTHTHRLLADNVFCFIKSKYPLDLTLSGNQTSLPDCGEAEGIKVPAN